MLGPAAEALGLDKEEPPPGLTPEEQVCACVFACMYRLPGLPPPHRSGDIQGPSCALLARVLPCPDAICRTGLMQAGWKRSHARVCAAFLRVAHAAMCPMAAEQHGAPPTADSPAGGDPPAAAVKDFRVQTAAVSGALAEYLADWLVPTAPTPLPPTPAPPPERDAVQQAPPPTAVAAALPAAAAVTRTSTPCPASGPAAGACGAPVALGSGSSGGNSGSGSSSSRGGCNQGRAAAPLAAAATAPAPADASAGSTTRAREECRSALAAALQPLLLRPVCEGLRAALARGAAGRMQRGS